MKVVVNSCFGGFGLSMEGLKRYLELKGKEAYFYVEDYKSKIYKKVGIDKEVFLAFCFIKDFGKEFKKTDNTIEYNKIWDTFFSSSDMPRDDPHLVQVIEELGSKANGSHADLSIVEIPDGIEWEIDEYDGNESVEEKHRSWS